MKLVIGDRLGSLEQRNSFVVRVETDGTDSEWKDTEIGDFKEGVDEAELENLLLTLNSMKAASEEFRQLSYDDPRAHRPFHFASHVREFPVWFAMRLEFQWEEYCEASGCTLSWDEYAELSKKVSYRAPWWPSIRDGEGDQLLNGFEVIYIDGEGFERAVAWSV